MGLTTEAFAAEVQSALFSKAKDSLLRTMADKSAWAEHNYINLAQAGAQPTVVVIDGSTFPLTVVRRTDTNKRVELKGYTTTAQVVGDFEQLFLSYNKKEDMLNAQAESLLDYMIKDAVFLVSPEGESSTTPILEASGDEDEHVTYNKLTLNDIYRMQEKFDSLNIPANDRYLLLHGTHKRNLMEAGVNLYKDAIVDVNGVLRTVIAGFTIVPESLDGYLPKYSALNAKLALDATPNPATDRIASICYSKSMVAHAMGSVNVVEQEGKVTHDGDLFRTWGHGLAFRLRSDNRGVGAIVSPNTTP
jgi:hypothetical protein